MGRVRVCPLIGWRRPASGLGRRRHAREHGRLHEPHEQARRTDRSLHQPAARRLAKPPMGAEVQRARGELRPMRDAVPCRQGLSCSDDRQSVGNHAPGAGHRRACRLCSRDATAAWRTAQRPSDSAFGAGGRLCGVCRPSARYRGHRDGLRLGVCLLWEHRGTVRGEDLLAPQRRAAGKERFTG